MNDQGQAGAAIPVWDTTGKGIANAIPMFKVTGAPVDAPTYPDDQGFIAQHPPQGAIPIKIVAEPTPNPDGTYPNDPANPNSAIPVYFVATAPTDTPPYPTDPTQAQGAIPVYVVT